MPANRSSFPPFASRNFLLRPTNQPSQKCLVFAKFVLQTHSRDGSEESFSSLSSEGTETLAEAALRIVRERMLKRGGAVRERKGRQMKKQDKRKRIDLSC